MDAQTSGIKTAALHELYGRIARVAEEMGGTATRVLSSRSTPSAIVATPHREDVPSLCVQMPDDFQVNFTPFYPLSIGHALTVQARRTQSGSGKSGWTFDFAKDGWRSIKVPLSDDEIRACLTLVGPRNAARLRAS
jgi:hypothetical protein